ncbi:hypothetical protein [Allocoleopsis sp.]|uniref:hypothetical protein n=1 Tax=Allocoleopsis sp. TaxID=3088169 RepID=UPI002FD20412
MADTQYPQTSAAQPKEIFPGEVFANTADFDSGIRQLLPRYEENWYQKPHDLPLGRAIATMLTLISVLRLIGRDFAHSILFPTNYRHNKGKNKQPLLFSSIPSDDDAQSPPVSRDRPTLCRNPHLRLSRYPSY